MELKPGYKQTEVGVIPKDWEAVEAREIGRFRGGNGFPTRFQGEASNDYPFYKVSDMNNEGNEIFMADSNNWISEGSRKQLGATAFPADSIIFAKVGAAVFLERKKILTKPSCIDNNLAALVLDKTRANVRFAHYALLNIKLGAYVNTTALPSLSGNVLSKITFALPHLAEQRAIATTLADVDALVFSLDRLIAKKRDLRQAAMQQLLTGKTRLPEYGGAKWKTEKLGCLSELYQSETIAQTSFTKDGYPVYGANGIIGRYSRYNHRTPQITVSCRGNCGTVNRTEEYSWITGNAMVVNLDKNTSVDHDFMFHLLRFQDFSVLVTGSGQPQIVRGPLADFRIKLPSDRNEQTAIARILTDMDAEIAALERRRDKTRALKQGMMQELLTGKTRLI